MEPPTSLVDDDAEFRLPPEFLTDDDFLLEKEENKVFKGDESNFSPYEPSHCFGLDSGFASGDEESFLTGLTRKTVRSTRGDDFSGGFAGKAWGTTRGDGIGCGHRNQNRQTRVSSQGTAWDLYCAAVEELARMNISDESYGYSSGRGGVVDLPRNHPLAAAAAKIPNHGVDYYSRQQRQAIEFQQQQLMQLSSRGLKGNNKNTAGPVDFSPSAWSTQPQRRDGSGMRAVFLTGKSRSTGTGVFLPRRVNAETREKPTFATVLVPDRVAQVLNLDGSLVQQPVIRSSASLYEASWRQKSNNGRFSSQMKMKQTMNEPSLPSDWAY